MLKHNAQRGKSVKSRDDLVAHLNSLQETRAEQLATAAENHADDDWVTDFQLRSFHYFEKSAVRDNVIVMQVLTNDPSGKSEHRLVLKLNQLPPAAEGEQRCSSCHEAGHQVGSCMRMFELSEADELIAIRNAVNKGLADPNSAQESHRALRAAQRIGKEKRRAVERESRQQNRLENRGKNIYLSPCIFV